MMSPVSSIRSFTLAALVAASVGLSGCASGSPGGERNSAFSSMPPVFELTVPRGLQLFIPVPEDNAITAASAELGRRLFFDPILSADNQVSCASCHRPNNAFADDVALSGGVHGRLARRNTPTLLNVAYRSPLTWDGRSATLEEQVLKPIQDPFEMAMGLEELTARLGRDRGYRAAFRDVFGTPITPEGVARALSSYLRTLRSGDTRADRFLTGDLAALDSLQLEGFKLFTGKARCGVCHSGPLLSDGDFHNTGGIVRSADPGRLGRTGEAVDRGKFRTPTLRHIVRTAPYMHDGGIATLEEVVEFYDQGGLANPQLSSSIRRLGLSADEKVALLSYLQVLGE